MKKIISMTALCLVSAVFAGEHFWQMKDGTGNLTLPMPQRLAEMRAAFFLRCSISKLIFFSYFCSRFADMA